MKKIINFCLILLTFITFLFFGSCEEDYYPDGELTAEIINITHNSAMVSGRDNSGAGLIEHGVCWNTTGNPTTNDFKLDCEIFKYTTWFSGYLINLKPNTKYFARPYRIYGEKRKTFYGNVAAFTTLDPSSEILLPSITTNVLESSITSTSATVMSTAINVGILNEVGIRYSSKVMPDIANLDTSIYNIKCKYNADGSFSAELTNLTPNTTYYIISYVINEKGRFNSIMLTIKTK